MHQKPEMDGIDARFEVGRRPVGPELDVGLRAELYGCETMPHLLESANRVAELGSDSALYEASADSRTLPNAHAQEVLGTMTVASNRQSLSEHA